MAAPDLPPALAHQGPGAALSREQALAELLALAEAASEHRERRVSEATRRYNEADWRQYAAWCDRLGVKALPVEPGTVALYLTDLARQMRPDGAPRYRASTLQRHVASLARKQFETGGGRGLGQHEAIADVLGGIRRLRQERTRGKEALLRDDVVRLVGDMDHGTWPRGITAARDTLALLLGFATALRRSELAALTNGQVRLDRTDGLLIRLGRSKTDQEGRGALVAVPFGVHPTSCVPCAWMRWRRLLAAETRSARMRLVLSTDVPDRWAHLCHGFAPGVADDSALLRAVNKAGEIADGHLAGESINALLKRRLDASGYRSDLYGAHSLRAGFVTQARRNGADVRAVRKQTRHASDSSVETYDRDHNPLEGNAVTRLGL